MQLRSRRAVKRFHELLNVNRRLNVRSCHLVDELQLIDS